MIYEEINKDLFIKLSKRYYKFNEDKKLRFYAFKKANQFLMIIKANEYENLKKNELLNCGVSVIYKEPIGLRKTRYFLVLATTKRDFKKVIKELLNYGFEYNKAKGKLFNSIENF